MKVATSLKQLETVPESRGCPSPPFKRHKTESSSNVMDISAEKSISISAQEVLSTSFGKPFSGEEREKQDIQRELDEIKEIETFLRLTWRQMPYEYKDEKYMYNMYFMKNEKRIYAGTLEGKSNYNQPCPGTWTELEYPYYMRSAVKSDKNKYKYICSVRFISGDNPFSSHHAAEAYRSYFLILSYVRARLFPSLYKEAVNMNRRQTFAWTEKELIKHLYEDIRSCREMSDIRAPTDMFYPDVIIEYPSNSEGENSGDNEIKGYEKQSGSKKLQMDKDIIDRLTQYVQEFKENMSTRNKKRIEELLEKIKIPYENYLENMENVLYEKSQDDKILSEELQEKTPLSKERNSQVVQSGSALSPEFKEFEPVSTEEEFDDIIHDQVGMYYYSVYILLELETGAVYIGSKSNIAFSPCIMWKKDQESALYRSARVGNNGIYEHIQTYVFKTETGDATEVISLADSFAAYLTLFAKAAHERRPEEYPNVVNLLQKMKPIVWNTCEIAEYIAEDLRNGRTILTIRPPIHPFVDIEKSTLDSVLFPDPMSLYVQKDMEDAIRDYQQYGDRMTAKQICEIYEVPSYAFFAVLKEKKIKTIKTYNPITREDVEKATAMFNEGTGFKLIIKQIPNLDEKILKYYTENARLLRRMIISDQSRRTIINILRAGISTSTVANYLHVSISFIVQLYRHAIKQGSIEKYGDPAFELADQIIENSSELKYNEEDLHAAFDLLKTDKFATLKEASKLVLGGINPELLRVKFLKKFPEGQRNCKNYKISDLVEGFEAFDDGTTTIEQAFQIVLHNGIIISKSTFWMAYQEWYRQNPNRSRPEYKIRAGYKGIKLTGSILIQAFKFIISPENSGTYKIDKIEEAYKKFPTLKVISPITFSNKYYEWIQSQPEWPKMESFKARRKYEIKEFPKGKIEEIFQSVYDKIKSDTTATQTSELYDAYNDEKIEDIRRISLRTFTNKFLFWRYERDPNETFKKPKVIIDQNDLKAAFSFVNNPDNTALAITERMKIALSKFPSLKTIGHMQFSIEFYEWFNTGHDNNPPRKSYLNLMKRDKVGIDRQELEAALLFVNHPHNTARTQDDRARIAFNNYPSLALLGYNHFYKRIYCLWKHENEPWLPRPSLKLGVPSPKKGVTKAVQLGINEKDLLAAMLFVNDPRNTGRTKEIRGQIAFKKFPSLKPLGYSNFYSRNYIPWARENETWPPRPSPKKGISSKK